MLRLRLIPVALSLTFFVLILVAVSGFAASVDPVFITSLGNGYTRSTALHGNFAYCADDECLAIYSIVNPSQPVRVGGLDTPPETSTINVSGTLVYLGHSQGLWVVDVSDPVHPVKLGEYGTTWISILGHISAGLCIYNSAAGQFEILDVSTSSDIHLAGACAVPETLVPTMIENGNYLYLFSDPNILTVDMTDPAHPTIVSMLYGMYAAHDAVRIGNHLYVPYSNGIGIVDVTIPATPSLVTTYSLAPYSPVQVQADGNILYATGGAHGITDFLGAYDVTNPTAPSTLGAVEFTGYVQDSLFYEGLLYLSAANAGLLIVDPSNLDSLHLVGTASSIGSPIHLALHDAYLYAVSNQFYTLNLANPEMPVIANSSNIPWAPKKVVINDDNMYVINPEGLEVYDLSNPVQPVYLTTFPMDYASDVAVQTWPYGRYAYVTEWIPRIFRIINVTDPAHPAQVSTVLDCSGAVVIGDNSKVYVGGNGDLHVIDILDPLTPRVLGSIGIGSASEPPFLSVIGSQAWTKTSAGEGTVALVDVSHPEAMSILDYLPLTETQDPAASPYAATVANNVFYLASGTAGLRLYDIRDWHPLPLYLTTFSTWGEARDVVQYQDYLYIADYVGRGLTVLRMVPAFKDVPWGYWAYDAIRTCYFADITTGFWDRTYRPNEPVTRAQITVYLARMYCGGDENVPTGPVTATFSDVPTDFWAYNQIEYCNSQGIVQGYWDGFHPTQTVTRAQMAVVMARALAGGEEELASYTPPSISPFSDVPTDHWAYKYIAYCWENGVVHGYADGTYGPANPVTRAQLAVFIVSGFGISM